MFVIQNSKRINIDSKYSDFIESWNSVLESIQLPNGLLNDSKINDVFQGNGYFLKFITLHFSNTLVLATEVKKVYCDEINYIMFPEVVRAIESDLKTSLPQHAKTFIEHFGTK